MIFKDAELKLLVLSIAGLNCVKFIYSEKATKFCEIFPLLLTVCTVVKSKGKVSQIFVAFSEFKNFTSGQLVFVGFLEDIDDPKKPF